MWLDYPTLGGSTWGYSSTVNWIRRVVWFPRVALRQLTLIQLSLLLQFTRPKNFITSFPYENQEQRAGLGLFSCQKRGDVGLFSCQDKVRSLTFAGASPFLGVLEMSTVLLLCLMPILEICGKLDLKHGNNEICWKCGSETWESMRNCSLIKSSSSGWRGRTVGHKWLLGVAGTESTVW